MSNAPTHSVHSAIATGPLLLLLFLLFGCLAPGAAFAVDGYDQLGFRTISDDCGPFFIGKYEAQDASIAYCMNQERPGPTKPGDHGSTLIKAGFGSTTSSRQSFVTDILLPRRLAATIFHPIAPAPPPSLPYGCSTALPMSTVPTPTRPLRAKPRVGTLPLTMKSWRRRGGSTTAQNQEASKPHRTARGAI